MRKLLKLTNIAVLQCIRHVNSITDLGDLPYHLVKPILSKMSAKQLDTVEAASNNIAPFSDELWIELIKKDFPTRPFTAGRKGTGKTRMPHKALYRNYEEEQELFRKNSTERLKHLTNMINQKKSQNKVVEVDEILRDPTVRVQRPYLGQRNSILNKARRELSSRSLMFPKRSNVTINPIRKRPARPPAPPGHGRSLHSPRKDTRAVSEPVSPVAGSPVARPASPARPTRDLESRISIKPKRRRVESRPARPVYNNSTEPSDVKSIKSSVFN